MSTQRGGAEAGSYLQEKRPRTPSRGEFVFNNTRAGDLVLERAGVGKGEEQAHDKWQHTTGQIGLKGAEGVDGRARNSFD
jgi:hypothetical protein